MHFYIRFLQKVHNLVRIITDINLYSCFGRFYGPPMAPMKKLPQIHAFRNRLGVALLLFVLMAVQIGDFCPAQAQTRPADTSTDTSANDMLPTGNALRTTPTDQQQYESSALGTLNKIRTAAPINQQTINTGVGQILRGERAGHIFMGADELTNIPLQSAEQNAGPLVQNAASNLANISDSEDNDVSKGLNDFYKKQIVSNLFPNIGQLMGKWLTEFDNGWLADAAQFLAKYLRIFVYNPNIAVNGLDGHDDQISRYVRQGADVMYGIAVDLLLLLFILCIWRVWTGAAWMGSSATGMGPNLFTAVGRLIFTAGLLLAWPTIYAFIIQISNEMIHAINFNDPDEIMMLDFAMAQMIRGAVVSFSGQYQQFSPLFGNPDQAQFVGQVFSLAGTLICTILGGIIIGQIMAVLVMKAIQVACLTAQYMFAPIFLVSFAIPDTESYGVTYVKAFVETSLWSFVWLGLLKIMTYILFSSFNPWGKILIAIGVLQLMIKVPAFIGYANISPVSDYVSAGLMYGWATTAVPKLMSMPSTLAQKTADWFHGNGEGGGVPGGAGAHAGTTIGAKNPELSHSLNKFPEMGNHLAQKGAVTHGPIPKAHHPLHMPGQTPLLQGQNPLRHPGINTPTTATGSAVSKSLSPIEQMEQEWMSSTPPPLSAGNPSVPQPLSEPGKPPMIATKKSQFQSQSQSSQMPTWENASQLHVDAKRLLSTPPFENGSGLRFGQPKTSVVGNARNGVQQINMGADASNADFVHTLYSAALAHNVATDPAAKNAARMSAIQARSNGSNAQLKMMADEWMHNSSGGWNSWKNPSNISQPSNQDLETQLQKNMFKQALNGSVDFLSGGKGNPYTSYLNGVYGKNTDLNQAEAMHLFGADSSNDSVWARAIGPAAPSIMLRSGQGHGHQDQHQHGAIEMDVQRAAMNPAIQIMHPSRQNQAVTALLSYTYEHARSLHHGLDSSEFKSIHGNIAHSIPADDVHKALSIYQISGSHDLSSGSAPHYIEVTSQIANAYHADFGSTYSQLSSSAPAVAREMGYLQPNHTLNAIRTYHDLAVALNLQQHQSRDQVMRQILEKTGAQVFSSGNALTGQQPSFMTLQA